MTIAPNRKHRFKTLGKAPFQAAKNNIAHVDMDVAYNASASGTWDELVVQLIYWDGTSTEKDMKSLPHYGYYPGKGVAALRSGWTSSDNYFAAKGGDSAVTHQDLDHGHFIWETKGYRWTHDLGPSKKKSTNLLAQNVLEDPVGVLRPLPLTGVGAPHQYPLGKMVAMRPLSLYILTCAQH